MQPKLLMLTLPMILITVQEISFTILKNFLLGATIIVRDSNKSKHIYSGYGITFDGASSWSFGINFARNVVIFGVDNSVSSLTDNCKNNFLVLGEGPTDDK